MCADQRTRLWSPFLVSMFTEVPGITSRSSTFPCRAIWQPPDPPHCFYLQPIYSARSEAMRQTWGAHSLVFLQQFKNIHCLSPRTQRNQILWLSRISWHKQDLHQTEQVFHHRRRGRIPILLHTCCTHNVCIQEQLNGWVASGYKSSERSKHMLVYVHDPITQETQI